MGYITSRLREPSTWVSLGVLYGALEMALASANWMTGLPVVLGALIGVLKGETKA